VKFCGIKIVVDPSIPDGEFQIRNGAGRILGKIVTRCDDEDVRKEDSGAGFPGEEADENG
jgi:hypothetical protein